MHNKQANIIVDLKKHLPASQIITDELRRVAYGSDASFYRLIPLVIAIVNTETEVLHVLAVSRQHHMPVTFRAAGTSLSGQAITDGILILLGDGFAHCDIAPDGLSVRLGPSMIGGEVNRRLAPFGRKIGPDPASINACKIGGIAANNASGMCCGTAHNSYNTLASLRIIFADGRILDTEDDTSVAAFRTSQAPLLAALDALASKTRLNSTLTARIRSKYRIKNTTGYSLNALIDYQDPLDILTHLMIGSEGTLGFIARIRYHTVPEYAHKASALVFFPDIHSACNAIVILKPLPVAAVELLDRAALRAVENQHGLPAVIRSLPPTATALLIETRADSAQTLEEQIAQLTTALNTLPTLETVHFSQDAEECARFWRVRKGIFPAVGAIRKTGTTVIIEDVAFPLEHLAEATLDLQTTLKQHGYHEAVIFGHALEGNLHFVFTQDFSASHEINRYATFMDDLCHCIVQKYDGSLKAEHGTGRNMAPFVELEWGRDATQLMREIKQLFDPAGLLNPGVILNEDANAHIQHLKPMPAADAVIDQCIECGFCETQCPSHGLTLSPRQRIISYRYLQQPSASQATLNHDFLYQAIDTCAGCGLCATACPVNINTGDMIKALRTQKLSPLKRLIGHTVARQGQLAITLIRMSLKLGHVSAAILGQQTLSQLSRRAWRQRMPPAGPVPRPLMSPTAIKQADPVVYFPTCGARMFGPSEPHLDTLDTVVQRVLIRAGYQPIFVEKTDALCCGQSLSSQGLTDAGEHMAEQLVAALLRASNDGQWPILMDASPCSLLIEQKLAGRARVYDLTTFAHDALLPRLHIHKKTTPVALHINCSTRRANLEKTLHTVVSSCAETVIVPMDVKCCGFGGDRGFMTPELNTHALRHLHQDIPSTCTMGVSTNRTCEIGLTAESGIPYHSVIYLLDECSQPLATHTAC